jgi:hypothetical protein
MCVYSGYTHFVLKAHSWYTHCVQISCTINIYYSEHHCLITNPHLFPQLCISPSGWYYRLHADGDLLESSSQHILPVIISPQH